MSADRLINYFCQMKENAVFVAFSGGVDSAVVLCAALKAGKRVTPVYLASVLHDTGECEQAKRLACSMGAVCAVLRVDETADPRIMENRKDRCYHCKKLLFGTLKAYCAKQGGGEVVEGTNADDLQVYRPGVRALREEGIRSPLAELGFQKQQVRAVAREWGLAVAKKPSTPCLATRFPYGTCLTKQNLDRVLAGESHLKDAGFDVVRLRVHGDMARIEIERDKTALFLTKADEIAAALKALGFRYITLDIEYFRSGSMDIDMEE